MSVTVDDLELETTTLGLRTVGEVLSHVSGDDRIVVQVLIDGVPPDLGQMETLRSRHLDSCAVFIETARPQAICADVLAAVDTGLKEADGHRLAAAEMFRAGDASGGLQKLSLCFALWNNAQDTVAKVGQLLRADLNLVKTATGVSLTQIALDFSAQLRQLKDALEARDFVLCCDVLTYDMESAGARWGEAVIAMRKVAGV